mmetsp:Transcript_20398/g.54609  ORF Transcript_20398/g.54609 Transcript_20398/m.54609 type:complete len:279 (-) Transcript_20398:87-923(-)
MGAQESLRSKSWQGEGPDTLVAGTDAVSSRSSRHDSRKSSKTSMASLSTKASPIHEHHSGSSHSPDDEDEEAQSEVCDGSRLRSNTRRRTERLQMSLAAEEAEQLRRQARRRTFTEGDHRRREHPIPKATGGETRMIESRARVSVPMDQISIRGDRGEDVRCKPLRRSEETSYRAGNVVGNGVAGRQRDRRARQEGLSEEFERLLLLEHKSRLAAESSLEERSSSSTSASSAPQHPRYRARGSRSRPSTDGAEKSSIQKAASRAGGSLRSLTRKFRKS